MGSRKDKLKDEVDKISHKAKKDLEAAAGRVGRMMNQATGYRGYRFPPEIIRITSRSN